MTTALRVLAVLALLLAAAAAFLYWRHLAMPGASHRGPLPPMDAARTELAARLRRHVEVLAGEIGPRNTDVPEKLAAARTYVREQLAPLGLEVHEQVFDAAGHEVANVWVELPGARASEIVVVGAHYDTCGDQPGADDNASGTAGLLEIARAWKARADAGTTLPRTLRLVAFVNEEPPWFKGRYMGSLVAARASKDAGEDVRGMISLEMLGDYRDEPGSQHYPAGLEWVMPSAGNYIGFVSQANSRAWVRKVIAAFRAAEPFPSEGIAAPAGMIGPDLSDHWSYWQVGVPALMVVDGGPFRNDRYHTPRDTPDTLDYDRFARVVHGLIEAMPEILAP